MTDQPDPRPAPGTAIGPPARVRAVVDDGRGDRVVLQGGGSVALQQLSRVVRYFQNHRVFTRENSPELNEKIPQLVLELITPSFSEQNEIWGALRVSYQPSALYKVRMVVFPDEDGLPATVTKELLQTVAHKPSA